jgi:hypothetical protein
VFLSHCGTICTTNAAECKTRLDVRRFVPQYCSHVTRETDQRAPQTWDPR